MSPSIPLALPTSPLPLLGLQHELCLGSADPRPAERRLQRGVYLHSHLHSPSERLPACEPSCNQQLGWCGEQSSDWPCTTALHQPRPLLAGEGLGPGTLQHPLMQDPRGDGCSVESKAGVPKQPLPRRILVSTHISAGTLSLHRHPSICRHNIPADSPTLQAPLCVITPTPLPASGPKVNHGTGGFSRSRRWPLSH